MQQGKNLPLFVCIVFEHVTDFFNGRSRRRAWALDLIKELWDPTWVTDENEVFLIKVWKSLLRRPF